MILFGEVRTLLFSKLTIIAFSSRLFLTLIVKWNATWIENGGQTGSYVIKFIISDAFYDTEYEYSAERGTIFYKSFTCKGSDLIYFAMCPDDTYLYIEGTIQAY